MNDIKRAIRIIHADGREETREGSTMLPSDEAKKIVGGWTETVWVLHQRKRTCMLVNETGAIQDPPLPINKKATEIYHNASRARGQDWKGAPYIHGTVILYEGMDIR